MSFASKKMKQWTKEKVSSSNKILLVFLTLLRTCYLKDQKILIWNLGLWPLDCWTSILLNLYSFVFMQCSFKKYFLSKLIARGRAIVQTWESFINSIYYYILGCVLFNKLIILFEFICILLYFSLVLNQPVMQKKYEDSMQKGGKPFKY